MVEEWVARQRGRAVISYDPNIRPSLMESPDRVMARVEQLVALSDVVKVSDEDLEWLFPGTPVEDIMRRWSTMGPALVVVTRGPWGAYARLANNRDMAHALRGQGYRMTFAENRDAHNWIGWRDALDPHLPELLNRTWS